MSTKISRPSSFLLKKSHTRNLNCLNYYVERDQLDHTSICICDNRVRKLIDVLPELQSSVFKVRHVWGKDAMMMSNDLAWPARTAKKYEKNASERNNVEFILVFSGGHLSGIAAHFTKDVLQDAEIGNTYGWSYWTSTDE